MQYRSGHGMSFLPARMVSWDCGGGAAALHSAMTAQKAIPEAPGPSCFILMTCLVPPACATLPVLKLVS